MLKGAHTPHCSKYRTKSTANRLDRRGEIVTVAVGIVVDNNCRETAQVTMQLHFDRKLQLNPDLPVSLSHYLTKLLT